jgi:hypothetical protein
VSPPEAAIIRLSQVVLCVYRSRGKQIRTEADQQSPALPLEAAGAEPSGAAQTGLKGRDLVFSETVAPDPAEASRNHDGQTPQLWYRQESGFPARGAPTKPLLK